MCELRAAPALLIYPLGSSALLMLRASAAEADA